MEVILRLSHWRHSGPLKDALLDASSLANAMRSSFKLRKVADYDLEVCVNFASAKEQIRRVRAAKKYVVRIQKAIQKQKEK
jgi:hypothetical protein